MGQTHCFYNTLGSEEEVKFGTATADEMCMDFIFDYPRQFKGKDASGNDLLLGNCGLFYPSDKSGQLSICGSLAANTSGTVPGLPVYVVPGQMSRGSQGYDDPLLFGVGLISSSGKPTTEPISTTSKMISSVSRSGLGILAIIFAFFFNKM